MVIAVAAVVAGLALVSALLSFAQRWYSARIGEGLIYDLRTQVFSHVQRQPIAFFTRAQTGSLVSRLNSDVIGAQQAITSTLSSIVSNALTLILVLIAMLSLSWLVTVITLVMIPAFVIPARLVGPAAAAADPGVHAARRRDGLDHDRAVQRGRRDAGQAVREARSRRATCSPGARPGSGTSASSPPCTAPPCSSR